MLDSRLSKYYHRWHIPTTKSLPLSDVLDEEFCYKNKDELVKVMQNVGIENPEKDQIILTCQRGLTACIVDAAFRAVGNTNTSVFDGSFEEYAKRKGIEVKHE